MKDKIIEILKEETKGQSINDINKNLHLKSMEDINMLEDTLNEMTTEGILHKSKNHEYMLLENTKSLKVGKLRINKSGNGFVECKPEDIFVHSNDLNGAINGDFVEVEIKTRLNDPEPEGYIRNILKRDLKKVVGEIVKDKKALGFKPDDEKLNIAVKLTKESLKGCVEGHKVIIDIIKEIGNRTFLAKVEKIIGHKNDPGVDILTIAAKHSIETEFSEAVKEELKNIPDEVSEADLIGRTDLTNEMIFTIDGDDTKDIDDAIELNILENGNYSLGVHIADVSYYVKEHTYIGDEAYERGTSVYLADRVIPMLPHKLSNGICSLNPNVDRLTISCVMEINKNGDIVSSDIFESVIRSRKQMTYKCVNKILEENIIPDGYEEFADKLKEMEVLAQILRKNKVKRGYIDFDIDESKIIVNDKGEAIDVVLRERGVGEKLIEDFMIAANEAVATTIYYMDLPFVYRVHGTPNEEKIKKFLTFVSSLGITINGKIKEITPIQMQKLLEQLKDEKEYRMLSSLLLRSMQKAIYDTNNIGHFGLGSKCYTHFTSPIRRFPDTTVHRLLRKYLFECKMDRDTISYLEKTLPLIALHSSEKERDAVSCEREVDDMKKAEYMEKHIGEAFTGMISGVTNFGIFVELPNLIEGLIKIEDIKGDKYFFDEATMSVKSKSNPRGYRLGDILDVVVVSANKEERKIDFEIKEKKKIKK